MFRFLAPMLVAAPIALAADVTPGSGRFPVFGPSAEREAFFAAQRDAEAARVAELERQRHEEELARIEAETAQKAARPAERPVIAGTRCFWVSETPPEGSFARRGEGALPAKRRLVCPGGVTGWPQAPVPASNFSLSYDDGDLSVKGGYHAPGLSLNFDID